LTHNLPKIDAEKIKKIYETLATEIKYNWRLNKEFIHPLSHLSGRGSHQKLPKISIEYRFNQNHLKSGTRSSAIAKRVIQYANSLDMPPDLRR
jgi:hypothetical protein